jgi:flotillin
MGAAVLCVLIALGLIAGGVFGPQGHYVSASAAAVMLGVGGIMLVAVSLAMIYSRLYRKPTANQAFVRTGSGRAKVILDGGMLVIPIMHRLVEVSLETMRLDVKRAGPDALITKDNLRVDIASEFYIRVAPTEDDILAAARSLGDKSVSATAVSELVYEKLVSALRSVAATKELLELHIKRDEFASSVQENLANDLRQNGLTLETVTISQLDQTPPENLNASNVFDAQGLRKITEITQSQNIERNRIERDAQRAIKEKDVNTRKEVLELERDQAEAEAKQATEVANIRAAKLREKEQYEIEQRKAVEIAAVVKDETVKKAEIAKNQGIQAADVARERVVQTASVDRDKAIQEAQIAKERAVEVARRQAEIAVAEQEAARAAAEAKAKAAEAEREAAAQKVQTVAVTAEADREAQKKMIEQRQVVDVTKYRQQTEADVKAYEQIKQAEAALTAADKQKQAKLVLAEADAKATRMRAEGDQAAKRLDVNVDRERVAVEQARVDVERQELENKQTFSEAALKFEVQKLEISAGADVQKAFAEAIGQMLSKAQMQIFGDPTTLSNMTSRFMTSVGYGQMFNGLRASLPDDAKQAAVRMLGGLVPSLAGALHAATGQNVDAATLEQLIHRVLAEHAATAPAEGDGAGKVTKLAEKAMAAAPTAHKPSRPDEPKRA